MNECKDMSFTAVENRIHAAKLERSAALGEAIGGAFANSWFTARRLLGTFASQAKAMKARTRESQRISVTQRIAAPH